MDARRASAALMVAMLIGVGAPVWAQDAEKGAALLAEARKAVGGADKLAAIKQLQVKGEFRRASADGTIEGEVELALEGPDKYKLAESTQQVPGAPIMERIEALNGTEIWDATTGGATGGFGGGGGRGNRGGGGFGGGGDGGGFRGGGFGGGFGGNRGGIPGAAGPDQAAQAGPQADPERLKEQQRRARQTELSRLLLAMVLTSSEPAVWIGTAQSPDGNAEVVEFKPKDGTPLRLFLDSTTHMPLMITWEALARGNAAGRQGRGRFGAISPGGAGGQGRGAPAGPAPAEGGQGAATPAPAGAPDATAAGRAQGARGGAANIQPVTFEMFLADYKTVSGIKMPHLITRGISGQTQEELIVKSYKLNPNFKANTFKQ